MLRYRADCDSLCDDYDVVLIQEHWLLPNELDLLHNVHFDFYGFGTSAVDITSDLLIGRPYGGTAILYRKTFADKITKVDTGSSRITAVQLRLTVGTLLLINVYMPTN